MCLFVESSGQGKNLQQQSERRQAKIPLFTFVYKIFGIFVRLFKGELQKNIVKECICIGKEGAFA